MGRLDGGLRSGRRSARQRVGAGRGGNAAASGRSENGTALRRSRALPLIAANPAQNFSKIPTGTLFGILPALPTGCSAKTAPHPSVRIFLGILGAEDAALPAQGKDDKAKIPRKNKGAAGVRPPLLQKAQKKQTQAAGVHNAYGTTRKALKAKAFRHSMRCSGGCRKTLLS